jgi:hypothetical protein
VSAGLWRDEFEGEESRETLNGLIERNEAAARRRSPYWTEIEMFEANRMHTPVSNEKAFATLGLLLGTLPPASIFLRFLSNVNDISADELWIPALLLLVNAGAAVTGFFTGKVVGRSISRINRIHPVNRLFALIAVGLLWGMTAGAGGGVFLFVIGAFAGAVIGGVVGAVALPVFAILHNLLRRGDAIDKRHLLPLAFGVALTICAFIFGVG